MNAIIDTGKGHPGIHTVHTEPRCTQAATLDHVSATHVTLTTALNGVVNGQWTACTECAELFIAEHGYTTA